MPGLGAEAGDVRRHQEAGAEFPGLDYGALRQFGAGDPCREAQVVLDPGGGTGLAAGGDRLQCHRVQPVRGAVHGRGRTRRSGTHDDEVAHVLRCVRDRVRDREPDDAGEFGVRRIAQHLLAVPDHDGSVLWGDTQALQQLLRPFVLLQIDPCVGQPVAHREFAKPQRVRGIAGADDPEPRAEPDQ